MQNTQHDQDADRKMRKEIEDGLFEVFKIFCEDIEQVRFFARNLKTAFKTYVSLIQEELEEKHV